VEGRLPVSRRPSLHRITLWHREGVPQKVYMERSGHTRYSISLDVYTHAMPIEEVGNGRFSALIAA